MTLLGQIDRTLALTSVQYDGCCDQKPERNAEAHSTEEATGMKTPKKSPPQKAFLEW